MLNKKILWSLNCSQMSSSHLALSSNQSSGMILVVKPQCSLKPFKLKPGTSQRTRNPMYYILRTNLTRSGRGSGQHRDVRERKEGRCDKQHSMTVPVPSSLNLKCFKFGCNTFPQLCEMNWWCHRVNSVKSEINLDLKYYQGK